jgi:hypothetical protein
MILHFADSNGQGFYRTAWGMKTRVRVDEVTLVSEGTVPPSGISVRCERLSS